MNPLHKLGSPFRTVANKQNDYFIDATGSGTHRYSGM